MHNRTPFQKPAFWALPLAFLLCCASGFTAAYAGEGASGYSGQLIAQSASAKAAADKHSQMEQALGLSPEQAQKVKAIMAHGKSQSEVLRRQLKTKREAMMRYVQSPSANEAGARSLNAEINELQRQLGEIRLKTWFSMRAELTPEQLEKLKALKAQRKSQRPAGGHHAEGSDF